MIVYFSATGNSRWVAHQLGAALQDTVADLSLYLRQGTWPECPPGTRQLGLVFPVHSWYVPAPVEEFVRNLSVPDGCYCYAVCTCGDDMGKGMHRLARLFRLDAAWSVAMPNTYIPMFNLDSDEVASAKVKAARGRIEAIAGQISRFEKVWEVHEGGFPYLKTYLVRPLFDRFAVRTDKFQADEGCTACGKCVRACPLQNVALHDGVPHWGNRCIHCMACIHACPQQVIQYGKATRKRGRYRLDRYL